jgi:hypothetical protein
VLFVSSCRLIEAISKIKILEKASCFEPVIIERITFLCKRQNKAPRSQLRGALLGRNQRFEVQCHRHRTLSSPEHHTPSWPIYETAVTVQTLMGGLLQLTT